MRPSEPQTLFGIGLPALWGTFAVARTARGVRFNPIQRVTARRHRIIGSSAYCALCRNGTSFSAFRLTKGGRVRLVETDYLVVGAGATGMAFVDTLVAESDVDVVMVDRRHRPGGHWLDAYPFVRLHQPSAYYGVELARAWQRSHRRLRSKRRLLRAVDGRRDL